MKGPAVDPFLRAGEAGSLSGQLLLLLDRQAIGGAVVVQLKARHLTWSASEGRHRCEAPSPLRGPDHINELDQLRISRQLSLLGLVVAPQLAELLASFDTALVEEVFEQDAGHLSCPAVWLRGLQQGPLQ